ncbi:MAG: TlpA family protein disulfide reductase [Fidelibacterota bacterium]
MRGRHLISAVVWIACLMLIAGGRWAYAQEEKADTTQEGEQETVAVPGTGEGEPEDIGLEPGDEAPKFALRDLEGNYELLTKWSGVRLSRPASQPVRHVVVASFFATWCAPCMKELPHLQNLYEKYAGQDVKFFLIDITEATRTVEGYENSPPAGPFLKKKGITVPVLQDVYGMTKKSYGVDTLPRLFIIDKLRRVRLVKQGFHEGEDFEGELAGVIDELLTEELQE